ncbi:MAG TPA: helical backbone metal receptor [Candidatus Sulfotelmatobacter sp.]|nr:helical backbone metal receptor [Candidatus Sulfotelmatobacter sp.]
MSAILAAALVGGACTAGGTAAPSTSAPTQPPPSAAAPTLSPTASPSPTATQPPFPLTIQDDEGTQVTLPAVPQRIVSLTPASTEELFALGEGSRLVGDTDSDDYPAAAKALPHVATFQGVIMEQVVAARPDLVIAGGDGFTHPADIARMRALGIPVVVIYAPTVAAVLADLRLVGEATGALPAATAMTTEMQRRMDAIAALAAAEPVHPTVFYEIGVGPDIYAPADDSFVADMVTRAGGVPITTGDPNSYTISLEKLVQADPAVIVLGDYDYGTTVADVVARPGWEHLQAVVDGAVRPVDDTIVTRPGPRLADGLAALALAIDPNLVLPADLLPAATPAPSPS